MDNFNQHAVVRRCSRTPMSNTWNSFTGSEESPLVDINNASVEDFVNSLCISHPEAEAIASARRLQGGFLSVADLLKVPGVTSDFNKKILTCSTPVSCCRHVFYTHRCCCRCRDVRCCKEEQVERHSETRCESNCCKKTAARSEVCCERSLEFKCESCNKESEHQCGSDHRPTRWCCRRREAKCFECSSETFLCAPGPSKLSHSSSGCGGNTCGHSSGAIVPNPGVKDAEINSIASSVRKLLRGSAASGSKGDLDFGGGDCSDALSESEMESSSEEEDACIGAVGLTSLSTFSPDKLLMKRKSDGLSDPRIDNPEKKPCRTKKIVCASVQTPPADVSMDSGIVEVDTEEVAPTENKLEKCHVPVIMEKRLATRVNPPPELSSWLTMFQTWSNAERLLALDRLIEMSEASQIRHMMCVIEPQFQRDFISLLPKELALYVLSFLEPRDLLRAAQTCRNWRILAEDNLLWREKCRETGIEDVREVLGKRRVRCNSANSAVSENEQLHPSPWKSAYMREHNIEMNWRCRPIRTPKVLKGHDDHVITCLQFSGNRIVSGSDDNTLKVWSALTGKCLKTLVGHTGGVWSSQMAGNIVISGSTDRTLKVWNADSGQCIHTLYGHTSTVRCMHLCGNRVVSGSRDATLRLWDVETGACLHVLVGHVAAVRCVQYNGKLVVSGAYDYMVKVWNPEREECLHTLQGHTNRVYSLQFDGVHVVSGSLDTSIRVWDVETGACKHTLMGHQSLTSGMELRNNILVSGNADSTVKVWDILTGQCLQTLAGPQKHQSAVTCLQFNSKFVVTSSDDGTVKLWDLKTGDFIRNLVALESGGSGGVVWRIRASAVKLVCAVGSRNGTEETKLLVLDFEGESTK